jgi:hypothetical protein
MEYLPYTPQPPQLTTLDVVPYAVKGADATMHQQEESFKREIDTFHPGQLPDF